jgi:histone deacetylase 1/2
MMDWFTNEGWHARVLTKDLVAQAVINQLKEIERQVSGKIKRLYSDGGSEFINQTLKAYLAREGIVVRISPPHTQQLNGLAERSIRTFKDLGRAMLHHVGGKVADWL